MMMISVEDALDINAEMFKNATQYPYRTASLEKIFLSFKLKDDVDYASEDMEAFLDMLAQNTIQQYRNGQLVEVNGVARENHVCYKLTNGMSLMISDGHVYVGTGIRTKCW